MTVGFIDSDMEAIVLEINGLLERIRQTIIKGNASSATLKSSIADISHDMKTPLTSVIGYLQLAERAEMICEQLLANNPVFEEKSITPHFEDSGK